MLIWGIGGGVATAAFEICRALGVRTIVTSGSDEKLEQARAWGADVAVNHHTGDVAGRRQGGDRRGRRRRRRDGRRGDLGPLARGGAAGRARGRLRRHERPEPAGGAAPLLVEAARPCYGSSMGTREDFLGAYDLVRSGRARVHVDRVFPLAETRAAHERLEAGEQLGKIVLSIPYVLRRTRARDVRHCRIGQVVASHPRARRSVSQYPMSRSTTFRSGRLVRNRSRLSPNSSTWRSSSRHDRHELCGERITFGRRHSG